jgi:hypothetical protein
MRSRSLVLSIIFAALLAGSITAVKAQGSSVTIPLPHESASNKVIDFYAGGSSGGYTLRISSQGGTLSIGDYVKMSLTPWGYVTAQWPTGQEYIIFLVNVTETDFRIGFLYLSNSTNQAFLLRMFDYGTQNVNLWNFQGAQHVYNNSVSTSRIQLPVLHLPPPPAVTNDISALGSQIYLTTKGGLLVNGTTYLNIYPVMNQLYSGATDYNEVWSLLADDAGNYYFAILYMQNNDPSHIIIAHQLRLNDYRRFSQQTINARWQKGSFVKQAIIRMPLPNLTVNVNGFPFQANNKGIVSVGVPNGIVSLAVPDSISGSTNSNMQFSSWSKFGSSNPLRILVNSTLDVTANYQSEYPLTVSSVYGNPQGSGVYSAGSNASFSVDKEVDYHNGTRRVFVQWKGDSTTADNSSWVILNSPKNIVAVWKTQYNVTIRTVGLPSDSNATILVENSPVIIGNGSAYSTWADANKQLTISIASIQNPHATGNYSLREIRVDNQTNAGILNVVRPLEVSIVFSEAPEQSPSLSLQAVPSFGQVLRGGFAAVRAVPYLGFIAEFTAALMAFGSVLAALLIPGSSSIAGELIGSIIVGFVLVFPVTAAIILVIAVRAKRAPRLLRAMPAFIFWLLSLGLVVVSTALNSVPNVVFISTLMLTLSNVLAIPIIAAFCLAKLVA